MTVYEWMRWLTFPTMPSLLVTVRKDMLTLLGGANGKIRILDVGGRKSPYTIGIPAQVTIMDIPRETDVQQELNLGMSDQIAGWIKKNRSNVEGIRIEDMTRTTLNENVYDAVVSVEVIEHVPDDDAFVKNIAKVIRPGGWAYFTTPNGDYIKNEPPNYNPDHVRHYTKQQLEQLLEKYFNQVEVRYAVKTGKYRAWGRSAYQFRRPVRTIKSLIGNFINRIESKGVADQATGTAHLIASVRKSL
ncbi:MAG: class I SAM-dependent methyltransferase [Cyclobacteriaceae bacterium]|nr:class I SAM-dependent methyltransferase [Cyclobacteriaceae bacterium]